MLPDACLHRTLEPFASTRQLALDGSQRATGQHDRLGKQLQNIGQRQAT